MFYTLTKETTAKVASCQPRLYADLAKDEKSIEQQLEMKGDPSFSSNSETVKKLWEEHCQDYADYRDKSVVQSILVNKDNNSSTSTYDAHSDVRKFGGTCNSSGTYQSNMILLITISFVLQYVCICL